jgi:hypothetical protein
MDEATAKRAVDDLRMEIARGEKRLAAQRKLVAGYLELYPSLATEEAGVPKGQEAVRRVLTEAPGKWFTVAQVVDELTNRGWTPESDDPANAVRSALARVETSDPFHIQKRTSGRGAGAGVVYRYSPDPLTDPVSDQFSAYRPDPRAVSSRTSPPYTGGPRAARSSTPASWPPPESPPARSSNPAPGEESAS